MENIKILVNKIKTLIFELNCCEEDVINELINQIKIIGLDINDLINWHSKVILKNNITQALIFINDKKRLEIYYNQGYHVDYYDDIKEIKSTFNISQKDNLYLRKIKVLMHSEKDYLFSIENDSNFYGETFKNKSGVMNTLIRCFDKKIDLKDEDVKYSVFDNIQFVILGNYTIEDLIKLIRIFELNPNIVMQHIKEIMTNSCVGKEVKYISYNEGRDFKFSNGKYHLDIHTLPISIATQNGGKVYEVEECDLEYFEKSSIVDYEQFTPWRYGKERNVKR